MIENPPDRNTKYRICWYGKNATDLCKKIYKNAGNLKLSRKYNEYQKYLKYLEEKNAV